jgi:hypothetical protein
MLSEVVKNDFIRKLQLCQKKRRSKNLILLKEIFQYNHEITKISSSISYNNEDFRACFMS